MVRSRSPETIRIGRLPRRLVRSPVSLTDAATVLGVGRAEAMRDPALRRRLFEVHAELTREWRDASV